jgi:hypothetical protein
MFEEFSEPMDDPSDLQEDCIPEGALMDGLHGKKHSLGMTPAQRFIVALVLLMMTIILGILLLETYQIIPLFPG